MKDLVKTEGPATISKALGGWMGRAEVRGRVIVVEACQSEAEARELLRASVEATAKTLGVSLPSKAAERTLEELGRRLDAQP